jgi:formate hydrogenlyase subunit 6/NADH:ubiquinone oxidoreductase subunit I
MNIFEVIARNLKRSPLTLRFPKRVALPPGFRGLVQLDPERCIGCGTCAYVCAPDAISVTVGETHYDWAYEPGRCTFCGRCVDFCPTQALTMEGQRPPIYTQPEAMQQTQHLAYPRCPACGQPAPPVNDMVLARAFGEITGEIRAWSRLCPHCRQRHYQPALVETGKAVRSKSYER